MTPSLPEPRRRTLRVELSAALRGEVRFSDGDRALYATDSSNYRQVPLGVVIPRDATDVLQAVSLCRDFGVPLLPRGAGTSLAGQTCNVAVVLDFSKYLNRVVELNPAERWARVQPGLILDDLRHAAERHHLTFGPDPATHNRCTLGGMIGNNACGVHSILAGKTDDNVLDLDLVTYSGLRLRVGATSEEQLGRLIAGGGPIGEIYSRLKSIRDRYADLIRARFPKIPRRVSGFALEHLLPENGFNVARSLVGTEGTCVTVLEATVRLVHSPPARTLVVLGYADIYRGADQVMDIMVHSPIGLEGFDEHVVAAMRSKKLHADDLALLPEGNGWLLVEFGGETRTEANDRAQGLIAALRAGAAPSDVRWFDDPAKQQQIWSVREGGLGATAFIPGQPPFWPGWEDSAAPPERFAAYLRDLRALMDRFEYRGAFYGHFGHGCLHTRIDFDLTTAKGIQQFRAFMQDAAELVVRYGGSLSGEHGDGQARAELLPTMYGPELVRAFQEFKAAWDPLNRMNPGKVVEPLALDQNLRLGASYRPAPRETIFQFPDDEGSLAQAALRCVGVGKCRRLDGGTMCPSFMATREEQHSTRGRARLLWEMLQGGAIGQEGWRDESVKEALDLCLACKGCKGECPVRVDMATYKAEFLAHYYAGRPRPVTGYTMGLIYWWARLAAHAPGFANFVTQTPILSAVVKWAGGIAPPRRIPLFAAQTFKQWFARRGPRTLRQWRRQRAARADQRPRVILWADTFNNHFTPAVAQAATEVLEAAGYRVIVPRQSLCCGRPLYDYGFLQQAQALLRQVLAVLGPEIRAGTPVVGLEPSCIAVFRDELLNLFPSDETARQLSEQSYLLDEFLVREGRSEFLPELSLKAVVHGHCHHRALMGMQDEMRLLRRLGLDCALLDSGCCGMAGAFGFERGEHYAVSLKAGERVLLPAVRSAAPDTLIVADGFSCREQIAQATDRRALHPAQVMQMALRRDSGGAYPEQRYVSPPAELSPAARAALAGAAAALVLSAFWIYSRHRSKT